MKILIAPDKFKGSLTALEVCEAIKKGILHYSPTISITTLPLADGGEGTLEVLESVIKFKRITKDVTGPRFDTVEAFYGLKGDTAYIEMALASGLMLLKKRQQHAPSTTTFGTGELIADAMEKGAKKIFLFVGGSATNDAGIGMAQALGYRFLNKSGDELKPIGASLNKIATITGKPNKKIATTEFILVSDVKNPLYGENGAAKIFARQKGADSDEIDSLDQGLKNFAKVMEEKFNKNISHTPGAGAAGGLGAGAIVFLNAKAKNGIKTIMDIVNFDKYIKDADFVISGEGKFDTQTLEGKVVQGVIEKCMLFDKQLGIICGISELQLDDLNKTPVKIIAPIMNGQVDQKTAFSEARKLVSIRAKEIMQILV